MPDITDIDVRTRHWYDCPVSASLAILGSRWAMLVVWQLLHEPRTFGVLRRRIGGISERMLTRELKRLLHHGVLERREVPGRVRYVRYALSPSGRALQPVVEALWAWGRAHSGLVRGAALSLDRAPLPHDTTLPSLQLHQ